MSTDRKKELKSAQKQSELMQESIATFQKTIDLAKKISHKIVTRYNPPIQSLLKEYTETLGPMRYYYPAFLYPPGRGPTFDLDQQMIQKMLEMYGKDYNFKFP